MHSCWNYTHFKVQSLALTQVVCAGALIIGMKWMEFYTIMHFAQQSNENFNSQFFSER